MSLYPQLEDKPGWAYPARAKRFHYFRDTIESLCHRWERKGMPAHPMPPTYARACKKCWRRRP